MRPPTRWTSHHTGVAGGSGKETSCTAHTANTLVRKKEADDTNLVNVNLDRDIRQFRGVVLLMEVSVPSI